MATDAAKKELDGLLNAGRQACGSLQTAGSASLSSIGLTKKLLLMPGLVADWKQSSARGGARTALTLAKAHYPELDLDLITSGIPESGEDGTSVDEAAIRQSLLGYGQLCALGTQLNVYYEAYDLPGSPSQASASVSIATIGADGGDEVSSGFRQPFKLYPAMWQEKNNCINSAPEWVCKLNLLKCMYTLHCA
jgi:hypothetical protein